MKRPYINWKKLLIVCLDIVLAVYLGMAMTSFNRPDETMKVCTQVNIVVADENTNGFLSAQEIKRILQKRNLYPAHQHMSDINPRSIEEALKTSSFVRTAECYKTQDGHVNISITQRLPVVRIKDIGGNDYYVDEKGGVMPNSKYVSDLIIVTGNVTQDFACNYLTHLASAIMGDAFWKNQIVQINILPDQGVELVPRVGEHIIFIGYLPQEKDTAKRKAAIEEYLHGKLARLEKFYRYGLSVAGWNKYHYISLEFDNQIICKKNVTEMAVAPIPPTETTPTAEQPATPSEGEAQQPGTNTSAQASQPSQSPQ